MSPELLDLMKGAFQALALGVVTYGVREIARLRESVEKLNVTVAQVLVRQDAQDKRSEKTDRAIEKHDERIRVLETHGGKP